MSQEIIDKKTIEDAVNALLENSGLSRMRAEHEFYCVVMPPELQEDYNPTNVYIALNLKTDNLQSDAQTTSTSRLNMKDGLAHPLPGKTIAQGFRYAISYVKEAVESLGLVFKENPEYLRWAGKD